MAIIPIKVTLDHSESAMLPLLRSLNLQSKETTEVVHALDALKVWKDWFHSNYGELIEIRHHSNPDDPPDMELCFKEVTLELEHTQLNPHPYGMVDVIHRREHPDQFVQIPALSEQLRTRKDIEGVMFGRQRWVSVSSEREAWLSALRSLVERKTKHISSGVLSIRDTAIFNEGKLRELAEAFDHEVQAHNLTGLEGWTILLHSRPNSVQHFSFLFQCGARLQYKINHGEEP